MLDIICYILYVIYYMLHIYIDIEVSTPWCWCVGHQVGPKRNLPLSANVQNLNLLPLPVWTSNCWDRIDPTLFRGL